MKLTDKQNEANSLLASNAQHILLEGGSRSGKTFLAVRAIVIRALKAPSSRHGILRFRFNHVKESIGMDTLPKVMSLCFPEVPYSLNKSDWFLQLPNQSEIWLGGIDDKERTEKILGKEYVTIFLNEISQIPFASRNVALTRLAQRCEYQTEQGKRTLALKMYYDMNPPSKNHWGYKLFHERKDPDTNKTVSDPENYAFIKLNPENNKENLPSEYLKTLEDLPVRLKKRFLYGEYAETVAGQLWNDEMIEKYREVSQTLPDMQRVIIAVDPSGSGDEDNADNDEIGIIVAGLGIDGNAYVLEDLTCKAGPKVWGNIATTAFDRHQADKIVAETNYGGEMVKYVVNTSKPGVPFKKLTASRGKAVRAEPISALTEQGKIRFAGNFPQLEDELCSFTTNGYVGNNSPNRGDAFVWAMSELFPGMIKEKKETVRKPVNQYMGADSWAA